MRVLYIITRGDTLGGAQVHVALMAARMKDEGHDVLVVYGGEPAAFFNTLEKYQLQSVNIPELQNRFSLLADMRVMMRIDKIIKQFAPDILSLHSTKAGLLFRFNGFRRKVTVVITVHGWAFTDGVSVLKKIVLSTVEKICSPFVKKYILVSEYDYNLALRHRIAAAHKFYVVHNGIPEIAAAVAADAKGSDDGLSIIMVARFDNQKDQQLLLNACRNYKMVTIHFVGDGPKQQEIEQQYLSGGFECKVVFWGLQYNVREHLAKADVFALISNWEGFPLSTLEAMSLGLPVIVSNVGGATECVRDGINGFVIPRGDMDALEAKISFYLTHKKELRRMGKASLQIFRESFTADIMFKKTIVYFNELLSR